METTLTAFAYTRTGVLNNQDLMGQVLKHLDDDLDLASTPKKQLLWAGLTCKTFLEPALDVMWRSIDSIMPLLRVLPSFHKPSGSSSYVLRGVKDEHWARYNYYARRVRKMVFEPEEVDGLEKISEHTIIRLAHLLPGPMLPSLRHYHISNVEVDVMFIHLLFLCPSLERLNMEDCSKTASSAVGTCLSAVGEHQSLKHLMLRGTLSAATLALIPKLTRISSLEIMGNGQFMDSALITKLGTLEHLEDLVLDLEGAPLIHGSPFPIEGGFPRLRSLHIIGEFDLIRDIFAHISSPSMVSLTIVAPPGPLETGISSGCHTLMRTLSRKWPTSLQRIKLDHQGPTHHGSLSMYSLQPLLLLPNIRSLKIEKFSLAVSRDAISKISSAWPSLVYLKLPCDRDERPDRPTITCLSELAQRCPQLETLYFPMNVDEAIPLTTPQTKAHNLRNLNITSSSYNPGVVDVASALSSVHTVARHLDCLFPRVKTVSWTHHGPEWKFWSVVGDVIKLLRETRAKALGEPIKESKVSTTFIHT